MDFPLPGTPWIELEFISTHYDFVSDIVKAEKSTSSTLELNKRLSNQVIEVKIIDIQLFLEDVL